MIAGGLGAQPRQADALFDFLETNKIIPFIESVLRVFDRHGERNRRAKARLKHLILNIGLDKFLQFVEEENKALSAQSVEIAIPANKITNDVQRQVADQVEIDNELAYRNWKQSNVFNQKQAGFFAVGIKVRLGDFYTDKARKLADLIRDYAQDELRLTISKGILIRGIKEEL